MKCHHCRNNLEKITRDGQPLFMLCRTCQAPHDLTGGLIVDTSGLSNGFNPRRQARDIIGKTHADAKPVTRSALEVLFIQGLMEAYHTGLKEGVLLAYSQDVREGEPYHGSVQRAHGDPQQGEGK